MTLSTRRRWLLAAALISWLPLSQAQAPAELRIGFQKGSFNLVLLKSLNLLDKHLPGVPVKWVEFPAGPQLLEALAVGSVDFGGVGDAPPVFAQAAGKDLFYVGAEPAKPQSSALLVKPGAAIVADIVWQPAQSRQAQLAQAGKR